MEIYNEMGKTKTSELRVTRPIGALIIGMSQPFSALTNETITAYIERAGGNNTEIMTDFPLKAFIGLSTTGQAGAFEEDSFMTALCELCELGSINLQDTESIKIKLDGLKSAVTYVINGLEYPALSNSVVRNTRKTILAGETERKFSVENDELALISGVDEILEMNVSYRNGNQVFICKYTPTEIKAISRDLDAVKLITAGPGAETVRGVQFDLNGLVSFSLIGVISLDIKKKSGNEVVVYLKNDVSNF